jgi:LacI family transcriptional regulator
MDHAPRKKRPTQADVARRAEVSQALVSYVLNDKHTVSVPEETRRRIMDAIEELGYVANPQARSLRTRKTDTIAAIIPDITNPFYPAFARGIQNVAEQRGYNLILSNTDGDPEKERQQLINLGRGHVDGAILAMWNPPADVVRSLLQFGLTLAALSTYQGPVLGIDSASSDNRAGARAAVAYLIGRGHRRIAVIGGEHDTPPHRDRVAGYHDALNAAGIMPDPALIHSSKFNEEGGYRAMRDLLRLDPLPEALFAANDLMAIGAMTAIHETGLRIPDDIAVVGFDDIPAARLVTPQLTTVAQFADQLGRQLAEMLFTRLEGRAPEEPQHVIMPYELIIRHSA